MRKLNIISPYREENYTALDAINKLLARRNFEVVSLDINRWESPYMQDFDGYIALDIQTMPSLWSDSIDARVVAQVPFHRTNEGAYTFGSYESRYTDFPHTCEPDYYKEARSTVITAWLEIDEGKTEDEIWFNWDADTDDPDQKKVQDLLIDVVKEVLVAFVMEGACQDENNIFAIQRSKEARKDEQP